MLASLVNLNVVIFSWITPMRTSYFSLIAALTTTAAAAMPDAIDYDTHLCQTAQRIIINAPADFPVLEQRGESNGFHTIQMGIDTEQRAAVIAMTTHTTTYDGKQQATYIACKMVNRERVNATLNLNLLAPDQPCQAVNAATYSIALDGLSAEARARYLYTGRQLQFADDAVIATGAEWLPVELDAFISADERTVTVQAPSVQVPWNSSEQNFFQGTQHCKLVSLQAMQRWVTQAAFDPNASLIPPAENRCSAPHSRGSNVGSCLFYFAPADSLFCQDYSGEGWKADAAQLECGSRHASRAALKAADNRYVGAGGVFSDEPCSARADAPPVSGTCVFHCQAADETLWQVSGAIDPRMTRGCDLLLLPE
jgi:hypothetical protein